MSEHPWTQVDEYLTSLLVHEDDSLVRASEQSLQAGLPPIAVAPPQGKLLYLLATLCGARSVLEIGTLGGYSTIWLAKAVGAHGKVVTLEAEPRHAEVARSNIESAGLSGVVEIRVGAALDTLPELESEGSVPFDVVFIDADKPNTPGYLSWALRLTRPGGLVIIDNVVRNGRVADGSDHDPAVEGVRRSLEILGADSRITATAIQTVGMKGYDGMAIALVGQAR